MDEAVRKSFVPDMDEEHSELRMEDGLDQAKIADGVLTADTDEETSDAPPNHSRSRT